ncbi:group II intron reverse transcriptase/maturase [Haliscomenobacter sp.]|uniref:group II intron reverse transcriptase/maturase n=1 Tax=Haliscomenobacter sp. TaxID=2717303 RepID=UPI003364C160
MEDQSKLRNKYQEKDGAEGQLPLFGKKKWEMSDAERVLSLQSKLYQKAKQDKGYKFYVLYDKVYQKHMMMVAWKAVKANQGSPGIDGISISDIEAQGVSEYLEKLGEELRTKSYRAQAVKRVMIPKANGGERPLGIPTVKDRIVQTACKQLIEPIFEADFEESSYGFRPERSSADALKAIKGHLQEGKSEVLDADLSKYFDTIPHDKLLIALKERISDPRLLDLIHQWLKAPIYEDGGFKGGKKNKVGTPQGGVISPLLANIYLNLLDRIVNNPKSLFHENGVKIVRYADDFVLMGKQMGDQIKEKLTSLLSRMGLSINAEKTRTVEAKRESFDFLGFTIRYDKDLWDSNKRYWNIIPSRKSEQKIRDKIKAYLEAHGHYNGQQVSEDLNKLLRGWLNYFDIKGVSYPAISKRRLRHYLQERLNRYYNRKSQRKCRLYRQKAFEALVEKYGLIDPTKYSSGGVRL